MKNYKYCIFIGNFAPFHNAQKAILDEALNIAENVIVVVGSSNKPRTIKNPWIDSEKLEMITSSFSEVESKRLIFVHMKDYLYNDNLWTLTLQQKISEISNDSDSIAIISFSEDESQYVRSFPQYSNVKFTYDKMHKAHDIRYRYFTYDLSYKYYIPNIVSDFLDKFQKTDDFKNLKEEFDFIREYKASWSDAPYEPIFTTVDGVILKSGHILLVKRKFNPGKGLLALPGGFLNPKEKLEDAVLREIKEETKISVNLPELRKAIVDCKVFDDPLRSLRGRTITHAYLIDLGVGSLPKIKANDDALQAMWWPLGDIINKESEFFEDHFYIIQTMTS